MRNQHLKVNRLLLVVGTIVSFIWCTAGFSYPQVGCNQLLRQNEFSDRYQLEESTETVSGSSVHYWTSSRSSLNAKDLMLTDAAIFIGIATNGHTYLVAGEHRFDGDMLGRKPSLKKSTVLSEGLVIRIPDPTGEMTAKVESHLKNKGLPRSLTCTSAACKVLSKSGADISVHKGFIDGILPQAFINTLATKGIRSKGGEVLDIELIMVGGGTLAGIQEASRNRTNEYSLPMAFFGGMAGLAGGTIASGL